MRFLRKIITNAINEKRIKDFYGDYTIDENGNVLIKLNSVTRGFLILAGIIGLLASVTCSYLIVVEKDSADFKGYCVAILIGLFCLLFSFSLLRKKYLLTNNSLICDGVNSKIFSFEEINKAAKLSPPKVVKGASVVFKIENRKVVLPVIYFKGGAQFVKKLEEKIGVPLYEDLISK